MLFAAPKDYLFLFGALPSLFLWLVFDIEGVNVIAYCAPFSLIIYFLPNIIFYLKGIEKKTIYIFVSLYFFTSSALGSLIVMGQYY